MTQECRDCRLAELPIYMSSCLEAKDVCPMEILAESGVMNKFEVVPRTIPEDLWREVEAALRLSADACHESLVALVLVGIICTIESVGAVALLREAKLPVELQSVILIVTLIEELSLSPRAVERAAIASAATTTDAVRHLACRKRKTSLAFCSTEGTALSREFDVSSHIMPGDDIDSAAKALATIDTTGCALEHLDAFYVADADGKVCRKMSCLGIADVDAVEQKRDLIKGAAIDADVRLNTKATTLTDVHACD